MGTTRRTANKIKVTTLAAALGLGSILGLVGLSASTASAETPEHTEEMKNISVLALPGDTDPQGPGDIAPAPTPDPEPNDDKAPVPHDDPEPEPQPLPGPGEIEQPTGHGDPEPDPDLPIGQPEEPECDPMLGSCDITDVPDEDDCNPILASCDLTSNPGDPGDDDETPEPEVEVEDEGLDQGADREALPRTGAGLMVLGAAGSALTGIGVTLRRLARR